MTDFDSERDPIDVLAEEFAERCRRGQSPSVSEYVERYPQWADQLRELLPPVAQLEQFKRLRQGAGPERVVEPRLEQLGDYRILREIGRGGMGIVYEAVQQSLGRLVALKVLPGHALLDLKKLERFRREAQAAANLHHTNIVPIFGFGEQDGLHYYVMQLIEGEGWDRVVAGWRHEGGSQAANGLATQTAVNRPTPANSPAACPPQSRKEWPGPQRWQQVARMGLEAAEALHYAHQQGTLHRDIKPANLLLDRNGITWVTDFGLAKLVDQGGITSTGDILGTLQYMAPESLEGRSDARSDVYSLGLTLYELLTLEPPFRGVDLATLLGSRGVEPTTPRKLNPTIPRDLETIVLKATARDPGHRYPTAQALADDLRRYLEDRPIQARRSTPLERLGRWCRRNPAVAVLTAALVIVFLGGFAGVFWKWQEAEAEGQRAEDNRHRAEEHRQRAVENLHRAERNEKLSLQALEEIFDHFAHRDAGPFFFGPPGKAPGPPIPIGPPRRFDSEEDVVLLQSILKFYDEFARENATNEKLRREAARAYRRVGEIQRRFGQVDKADAASRRAATMLEELIAESSSAQQNRLEWAEAYTWLEVRPMAAKELAEAEQRLRKALVIAAECEDDAAPWRGTTLTARARGKLGSVLHQQGRTTEAEAAYREAVRLRKALMDEIPPVPFAEVELCTARQALAGFFLQRHQLAEARGVIKESIADLKTGPALGPGGWFKQKLLMEQYQSLAVVLLRLDEPSLAAEATREAERLAKFLPFPKEGSRPPRDKKAP